MKSTTFSRDVNRKISEFLSRVRFKPLMRESDVVILLGSYLQKSGYDVILHYELNSLVSMKKKNFPTVRNVDIMVKNAHNNDFFPIEVRYFRGINMTQQRRRDLMESYSVIQAMLHTYGIIEGGRTICITDNPYLSGDVRTARQLSLVRSKDAEYLRAPSKNSKQHKSIQTALNWKESVKESNIKYASLKSEQILDPEENSLDNDDEVICSWHEQLKKKQNGEHIEF